MRNFDKFHINAHTVLGLGFSLFLAGCTLPTPEKKTDSSTAAMFYIDKSTPQILEERMSKEISIPVEHNVNIAVCLKDIKSRKDIPNESFIVNDADNKLNKNLRTDSKGCLVWTEVFPFSFFGTGKPVQIDRLIQGQGSLQGVQKVSFQYNPWEKTIIALKEQTPNNSIGNETTLHLLAEAPEQKSMILDNMRLTIEEKAPSANSANLNMEIRTSAQVPVTKSNKAKIYETLSFGEFKTTIYLIHVYFENGKEVRQLLSAPIQTDSKIANQVLLISSDFQLPILRSRSQFYVGLKVEPKTSITGLKPFEGVFNVGEFDQIKGNFLARIKNISLENPNFKMEEFVNLKDVLNPATSIQNGSYINAAFKTDKLKFENFEQKNKSTYERTLVFTTTACIHSNIDRKTAKGQDFTVTLINGRKEKVKANQLGCLEFVDSIDYNFLENECKNEFSIQIENSDLGLLDKIPVQINPWNPHEPVTDVSYLKNKEQLVRCTKEESVITIENFLLKKVVYNYKLDTNLSLITVKNVSFNGRLSLKRPSLTEASGFDTMKDVPKGHYLVKLAIVSNDFDFVNKIGTVYSTSQKVVEIDGSSFFSNELSFEIRDLKSVGSTNRIVFEIRPIDSIAYKTKNEIQSIQVLKLKKQIFVGAIEQDRTNESISFTPFSLYKDTDYIKALETKLLKEKEVREQDQKLLKDKKQFAKLENLIPINLNQENSENFYFLKYYYNKEKFMPNLVEKHLARTINQKDKIDLPKLQRLFENDQLSEISNTRLCNVFKQLFATSVQKINNPKSKAAAESELDDLYYECITNSSFGKNSFFDIQYRIIVDHLKSYRELQAMTGDFINSFTYNQSRSYSLNSVQSLSADVGGSFTVLPLLTDSKLFNASAGLRYSFSRSKTDSHAFGSTINVQLGVSSFVSQQPFELTVDSYEKCAVIKINPASLRKSWDNPESDNSFITLNHQPISKENQNSILSQGFLFCDNLVRKKPITMLENYYIIDQKSSSDYQGVDQKNYKNRIYFVDLRGTCDFINFISYVGGRTSLLNGYDSKNYMDQQSNLSSIGWKGFSTPSYPGHFVYKK